MRLESLADIVKETVGHIISREYTALLTLVHLKGRYVEYFSGKIRLKLRTPLVRGNFWQHMYMDSIVRHFKYATLAGQLSCLVQTQDYRCFGLQAHVVLIMIPEYIIS